MKRILNLFLLFSLSSCATAEATGTPIIINTKVIPASTQLLPTSFPIHTSPTITPTVAAACDPFSVDYCITDGHFIFQRPIHPPANDRLDQSYLFGSTADGTREPHHGVEFPNPSGTP